MGPIRCHGNQSFDPFHPILLLNFCLAKIMGHVKFDGYGFIGFRNFAFFVVDFFFTDRTFEAKLLFP